MSTLLERRVPSRQPTALLDAAGEASSICLRGGVKRLVEEPPAELLPLCAGQQWRDPHVSVSDPHVMKRHHRREHHRSAQQRPGDDDDDPTNGPPTERPHLRGPAAVVPVVHALHHLVLGARAARRAQPAPQSCHPGSRQSRERARERVRERHACEREKREMRERKERCTAPRLTRS